MRWQGCAERAIDKRLATRQGRSLAIRREQLSSSCQLFGFFAAGHVIKAAMGNASALRANGHIA
jgi:hypothetical protein